MKTQTALKTALLLTVLAMMTACGSQNSIDNGDLASRAAVTTTSTTTTSGGINVLYCNQQSSNGLTMKIMSYTNSANQVVNDYMKMKVTSMPASFGTNGDYIQLFRWQANTSGTVYLDPTPVQARFETLDGRPLTDFSSVIYWGMISGTAANSGMDMNTLFANVRLVVNIRDPQAAYDALRIVMYNGSSNAVMVNMDVLMPAFAASPSDYANDNGGTRASVLQALHPFASYANAGYTSAQFLQMGNNFCF